MTVTLRRILLVEDNEVNRNMLTRRLERAGHSVITAADGAIALDMMLKERPALVLMDMNLPVKDCWTACRVAHELGDQVCSPSKSQRSSPESERRESRSRVQKKGEQREREKETGNERQGWRNY